MHDNHQIIMPYNLYSDIDNILSQSQYTSNDRKKWAAHKRSNDGTLMTTWAILNNYQELFNIMVSNLNQRVSPNISINIAGDEKLLSAQKIQLLELVRSHVPLNKNGILNWAIIYDDVELMEYAIRNGSISELFGNNDENKTTSTIIAQYESRSVNALELFEVAFDEYKNRYY